VRIEGVEVPRAPSTLIINPTALITTVFRRRDTTPLPLRDEVNSMKTSATPLPPASTTLLEITSAPSTRRVLDVRTRLYVGNLTTLSTLTLLKEMARVLVVEMVMGEVEVYIVYTCQ
jgi:hypothetical protein